MITVFYDGKCGLCSKEINYYRRIAPSGVFNFQDITQSCDELDKAGITLSEGLKILHVRDNTGLMHKGVDAFIVIWRQLRFWRMVAAFISCLPIRQVANILYHWFANWRFKRLPHCQLAAKSEKK